MLENYPYRSLTYNPNFILGAPDSSYTTGFAIHLFDSLKAAYIVVALKVTL